MLPANEQLTAAVPLVTGSEVAPTISAVFYGDMVEPQGLEARDAFRAYHEATSMVGRPFQIGPRLTLIVNNAFAFHKRDAF